MRYIEVNETQNLASEYSEPISGGRYIIIVILCDKCFARNDKSDQLCETGVKKDFENLLSQGDSWAVF